MLWSENDDYNTSIFDCKVELKRDIKKFNLDIKFELKNLEIENLIRNRKAEFVLHIECPETSYRKIVSTDRNSIKWTLKDEDINGKISFCSFIVAKENINKFNSKDWNNDYDCMYFDYERGSIIAIGTQSEFDTDKEEIDLKNVPSIFTIYKKETDDDIPVVIEINQDKIQMGLNIKDYNRYYNLTKYGDSSNIDIINTCLIFPALIYVINELSKDFDEYSDYRWFRALEKMMKNYGVKNFNKAYINDVNSFELAQKIMSNPISKALFGFEEINNRSIKED